MTPVEEMGGLLGRLPWATSFGEAPDYGEEIEPKQAQLEALAFFDFHVALSPRVISVPLDRPDTLFRFLSLPYSAPDAMTDLQQASRRGSWAHDEQERAMARLEDAANAKDEHAFLEALKEVEWRNRPPADFTRAAQWALKAGAYKAAYQISAEGAKHHPDNLEVQKYARVLAPPKVVSGKEPPDPTLKANRKWLEAHEGEYPGQWVAIRNGELLGMANSLEELAQQVGNTKDALLTRAH